MPPDDARAVVAALAAHDLLPKGRAEKARALAATLPDAATFVRELVRRGDLTPYQANEIIQGRAAGLSLGQYLVLDRIGAGGMGAVYKARHRVLDRLVALKVIRPEYVDRPEAVERFRRECRAAALLSHPNIILVHDAHQAGAVHFLAMEYVEGKDLGQIVKKRGALPAAEACEYARQAALGLQHAHERGLVHRDVKPANLIVTADGVTVKVLDLGLARLRSAPGAAEADPGLTREGVIMGTPDYLPPEQAGGDSGAADARADIYSLGCTLYHLIAGRTPFSGDTLGQKIAAHLTREAPSLDQIRPGLPLGLPSVVRRMMAKDPAARYPTAAEAAAALAPFCRKAADSATLTDAPPLAHTLPQTPTPAFPVAEAIPIGSTLPQTPSLGRTPTAASLAPTAPRRRFGVRTLVVAAAVVLVVVGLTGFLLSRPPSSGGRGPVTPDTPVVLKNPDSPPNRPDDPPKIIPRDPAVPVVPVVPVVVNLPPSPEHLPTRDGVQWPPPECVVLGDRRGAHWGAVGALAFHPGGQLVATADQTVGASFIHLWDVETLQERVGWTPAGAFVMDMAFSPDGRLLAAACGDGVRLWDFGDGGPKGERLFGRPGPGATNIFHVSFTADGRSLLTRDAAGAFRRWRLVGGAVPAADDDPVPGPQYPVSAALSADGRTVTYTRPAPGTRKTLLCVRGLFGKEADERTAELSSGTGGLALSADGRRLAASVGDHDLRVWEVGADEPRVVQTVALKKLGVADTPTHLAFTPDGGRVLIGVAYARGGPAGVWVVDVATGEGAKLDGADAPPRYVACAADGKVVAVVGADNRLRLWDDRGKGFEARPAGPAAAGVVRRLAFRPGAAELAVVSRANDKEDGQKDLSNLIVWDWGKGAARETFTCPGWFSACAYAPDGGRLFVGGSAPGKGDPVAPFREGFLRAWRADALKEETPPRLPDGLRGGPIDVVTFDAAGKTLALLGGGNDDRRACVCDPWPFRVRGEPFAVGPWQESFTLAPDGATAAALAVNGQGFEAVPVVKLWDVRGAEPGPAKEVQPANPLEGAAGHKMRRLTYSPDGKTLAALVGVETYPGVAGTFLLWDVKTGRTRGPDALQQVDALAFSPDGRTLATAGSRVSLWRADGPALTKTWDFPGATTAVAFSPDGAYLAVGDGDGTVAVLKLPAK